MGVEVVKFSCNFSVISLEFCCDFAKERGMASPLLRFPPFRLDPSNERLWDETHEIPLRRKTFAVLRYLMEHPKQLVTKEEMMDAVWPGNVGAAYYLAGWPEEAIAPLKQHLTRYPNILGAHLTLAAVCSELGKDAEAQAEAAEVLRISPKLSLKVHKERVPIKDPALVERHIAALRKAGFK